MHHQKKSMNHYQPQTPLNSQTRIAKIHQNATSKPKKLTIFI